MSSSVGAAGAERHPVIPDMGRRMAKAHVRNPDSASANVVGECLAGARGALRLSIKETAALLDVDEREYAKWESGARNVQLTKLRRAPHLCALFVLEWAARDHGIEVVTQMRYRRLA